MSVHSHSETARAVATFAALLVLLGACDVNTAPPSREVVDVRDDASGVLTTTRVTSLSELTGIDRVRGHLVLDVTGPIRLPALTTIDGDLTIVGTEARPLSSDIILAALTRVGGSVRIAHSAGQGAILFPSLLEVGTHLDLSFGRWSVEAPVLTRIGGDLRVHDATLLGINLAALQAIGGGLFVSDLAIAEDVSLTLPRLESVAHDVQLAGPVRLAATRVLAIGGDLRAARVSGSIDLAGLRQIGGDLHVEDSTLDQLVLGALRGVGDDLMFEGVDGLTLLDLPLLESVPGRLRFVSMPSLTSFSAPNLPVVAELLFVDDPALAFVGLKRLARVTGDAAFSGNGTLSFVLDALASIGGDLIIGQNIAFDGLLPRLTDVGGDVSLFDQTSSYSGLVALKVVGGNLLADRLVGTDEYDDLRLAALRQVGGSLRVERLISIEKVAFDTLASVGLATTIGDLVVTSNRHLTGLDLPKLKTVGGRVEVTDNPRLPTDALLLALEAVTTGSSSILCGNLGGDACTD